MPAAKSGVWRNPRHGTATGYCNYGCRCHPCREWNAANQRRRRQKHPEATRAYARRYMRENPDQQRKSALSKYGLTLEAYEALLAAQGGVCAICKTPPASTPLHVDHDHRCCPRQRSCGLCIRGLLCSKCNSAVGFFDDSPERLERAMIYLSQREYQPGELPRRVAD